MSAPVPLIVSGATGRMGQAILRIAATDPEVEVVGVLESAAECSRTKTVDFRGNTLPLLSGEDAIAVPPGAVLIEFTSPEATLRHVQNAATQGLKAVIGTTGFTDAEKQILADVSRETSLVVAANMSVGVTVLLDLVSRVSGSLPEYDIEIVEMHHRLKKDAPSGTALALGVAAATGRNRTLKDVARSGRDGLVGERPAGEIGFHAVRGGDVVGDHTVTFAGIGERIELIHRASSRDTFAAGALKAAKFLNTKTKGLYSMKDVLGL
ncbi:MAG: 4-hydroxy-tetrahydrodipicolinate reductase [Candidatus Sumerlaeaceae bacterium]|nr:4-hydroxy-tetrahydrodipicolinate reductase [Candidatus Sumerlaeaceae bacterium]